MGKNLGAKLSWTLRVRCFFGLLTDKDQKQMMCCFAFSEERSSIKVICHPVLRQVDGIKNFGYPHIRHRDHLHYCIAGPLEDAKWCMRVVISIVEGSLYFEWEVLYAALS